MSGVYIVGVGPGHPDYLTSAAREVIAGCQVLIGGARNLSLFPDWSGEKIQIANNLELICSYLAAQHLQKRIAVLVSGDPGLFSMLQTVQTRAPDVRFTVIPGISSLQYMAAKLGMSWHDWRIISLHGKEAGNILPELLRHRRICIFTGGKHTPATICQNLLKQGFTRARVWVGENLSYPRERLAQGDINAISGQDFEGLSLMLLEVAEPPTPPWPFQTPGIPEDRFIRGEVPLTKTEVRAVSLAKLRLQPGHCLYDIGAGTGSVAVECALQCREGLVYAVEKKADARDLIARNAALFGVLNLRIVAGEAPGALDGLPAPDRVFIGGSGGGMISILERLSQFGKPFRVVINAVTIESCHEALTGLASSGFGAIEVAHIAVARGKAAGGKHLLQALNPVFIISAAQGESEKEFAE
ncbi:MAG: precorrin-6y C5,15-methyltransferase (decarboxylating) subunit CbiE [Bacillota bacterium]|jgi:precorrin-6Y C5,15-methyltransferase (decarboxylating)